jgi:hypothetical protein
MNALNGIFRSDEMSNLMNTWNAAGTGEAEDSVHGEGQTNAQTENQRHEKQKASNIVNKVKNKNGSTKLLNSFTTLLV